MIVYKSRRFTVRRYRYGGSGIVKMIGSLLARYATKAMLTTATNTAMQGTLDAAKRAVPHLIAHKVASTTAVAAKKRDTLQLIRKDDNDALFRTAAAGAGKVVLSKLAWSVPIVQPNDVRKVNLYKSIASNNLIYVSFRLRQCETLSLPKKDLLYGG